MLFLTIKMFFNLYTSILKFTTTKSLMREVLNHIFISFLGARPFFCRSFLAISPLYVFSLQVFSLLCLFPYCFFPAGIFRTIFLNKEIDQTESNQAKIN